MDDGLDDGEKGNWMLKHIACARASCKEITVNDLVSGDFGPHACGLVNAVKNISRIKDPEAQRMIAGAVLDGKFGTDPGVLMEIATNLNVFTDPEAQVVIADAILNRLFGSDPGVLNEIATNLSVFTDPRAQRIIASAIENNQYRNDPAFLTDVAFQLNIFADLTAQQTIARVIYDRGFGTEVSVRRAIATNLSVFTDPEAQQTIACVICDGGFGTDVSVLRAIATNLNVFTDPVAQRIIASTVYNGRFGSDLAVLTAIATNLIVFTGPEAQRSISSAFCFNRFGTNPSVLRAIATNLTVFTDPEAQRIIANAFFTGRFGTNPEVLLSVMENWNGRVVMAWPNRELNSSHQEVFNGVLNVFNDVSCERRADIYGTFVRRWSRPVENPQFKWVGETVSLGRFIDNHSLSMIHPVSCAEYLHQPLGRIEYTESELTAVFKTLYPYNEMSHGTQDAWNAYIENYVDLGSHFAQQVGADDTKILITMSLGPDEVRMNHRNRNQSLEWFQGWITSEYEVLYRHLWSQIVVHRFWGDRIERQCLNEIPIHGETYNLLPAYLQFAISQNQFRVDDYVEKTVLKLVADDIWPTIIPNQPDMVAAIRSYVSAYIESDGQDQAVPVAFKQRMYQLSTDSPTEGCFESTIDDIWDQLTPLQKVQLGYVLGRLASVAMFGYETGAENRAYLPCGELCLQVLSKRCDELSALDTGITDQDAMMLAPLNAAVTSIKAGHCIQMTTAQLREAIPGIADIFKRHQTN